jgi:hypothetical protein
VRRTKVPDRLVEPIWRVILAVRIMSAPRAGLHFTAIAYRDDRDALEARRDDLRQALGEAHGTTHVETTLYGAGWLPASDARRAELERLGCEVLRQAQGRAEAEPDL